MALVSREVDPLTSGGIGAHVSALAKLLEDRCEVTIVTSSEHESRYRELADDPALPSGARFAFVPEPDRDDFGSWFSWTHRWSALVARELRGLYSPGDRPLIEFPDFLGQAAVGIQARRGNVPELRGARVAVRLHTSAELCAVLDGYISDDQEAETTFELERYSLAHADAVLWPGGDVLGTYHRFYREPRVGPASRIPNAFGFDGGRPPAPPPPDVLRLLYLGRLERRKGVQNLIRAATSLMRDDWRLSVVGADTDTGPLAGSVRDQLELMAGGDPRIDFLDSVPRDQVPRLIGEHHAVVLPSLWECWPTVALEALTLNRPVIATPTGGFLEMIETDASGWLARHATATALAELLEELLDRRERVMSAIEDGRPRSALGRLVDEEAVAERYLRLAEGEDGGRAPGPRREPRLVSVVIPYHRLEDHIEETVASALDQSYPRVEIVLVNDGSLRRRDEIVYELAERHGFRVITQPNAGLGAARNAGIRQSRGYYVFPLDADNVAEPEFVERCVELLDEDESLAYATSWLRYIDEDGVPAEGLEKGYQPLGNWCSIIRRMNVAGDAAAVLRRRIFDRGFWYSQDLTSFEDWELYQQLHSAGLYGHVIPERLLRYRVREGSMLREVGLPEHVRLKGEMKAHVIERGVEWERKSA